MSELKPCPFCGSNNVSLLCNGIGDVFACCDNCEAQSSQRGSEVDAVAIHRWNTRASKDSERLEWIVKNCATVYKQRSLNDEWVCYVSGKNAVMGEAATVREAIDLAMEAQ